MMSTFHANIAHWRFNTYHDVLKELLRYKHICVVCMKDIDWSHSKEQDVLKTIRDACGDAQFWIFVEVFFKFVMEPLEQARWWSMSCSCCKEERAKGRKPKCKRASRRMREARDYFKKLRDAFALKGRTLSLADCKGDKEIWRSMQFCCKTVASKIEVKTGNYGVIPYILSEADTPEGAAECMHQLTVTSPDDLDTFSKQVAENHLPALRVRAFGGPVCPKLAAMVRKVNNIPLSELLGEGYHRKTNLVKKRAPASKEIYIKAKTRQAENHARLLKLFGTGWKGIMKFRRHWYGYKGLLRTDGQRRHGLPRSTKDKRLEWFRKVYRMDDAARIDWAPVVLQPGVDPKPKPIEDEALVLEFARKLVKKGITISVIQDCPTDADDELRPTTVYYEVVDVVHGRSRPHMLPSLYTATHLAATATLALHVQHYAVWNQFTDAELTAFPDVDVEWLDALEVFRNQERCFSMQKWTVDESTTAGCFEFTNPAALATTIPVLDVECPTMVVLAEMHRRGWLPINQRVLHDSCDHILAGQTYDARKLMEHRFYLQCCLAWDRISDVNDKMASAEPQLYYRLLLAGREVMYGLGNAEYQRLWADLGEPLAICDDGEEVYLALPPPYPPCPLPLPPVEPDPAGEPAAPVVFLPRRRPPPREGGPPTPPSPLPLDDAGPDALPIGPFLPRPPPAQWKYTLPDGARLRRDHYIQPGTGRVYKNWVLTCNIPGHEGCKKASERLS
jgi:hypothetical protein